MPPPSDRDLLAAWDRGADGAAPLRGLALLGLARPGWPDERLAATSLGERDDALLDLHRRWFGPVLDCVADCPQCSAELEFAVPVDRIRASLVTECPVLKSSGRTMRLRLPTTADALASAVAGPAGARRQLLRRCFVDGTHDLPDDVLDAAAV